MAHENLNSQDRGQGRDQDSRANRRPKGERRATGVLPQWDLRSSARSPARGDARPTRRGPLISFPRPKRAKRERRAAAPSAKIATTWRRLAALVDKPEVGSSARPRSRSWTGDRDQQAQETEAEKADEEGEYKH